MGKTTAALQILKSWTGPSRYAAAEDALPTTPDWIRTQWMLARRDAAAAPCLLVLDELQKIPNWSETVKALWDEDKRQGSRVTALLLGSSALLLAAGSNESLAGRFLLYRCPHWTARECGEVFGWDLDRWLVLGGYLGAAVFADDPVAWRTYVRDAIIEPALARDVLAVSPVRKPALLRNLFLLACRYPAQELSFTKMLGQLHEAGNTTTLANYLHLCEQAWLLSGIERYSGSRVARRASSPKLVLWTNSLATAAFTRGPEAWRQDGAAWGRLVENAVGAHLLSHLPSVSCELSWWRDGNDEVDFVVQAGEDLWAVEVKSGRPRMGGGLQAFARRYPKAHRIVIGTGGVPLLEFFNAAPDELLLSLVRDTD